MHENICYKHVYLCGTHSNIYIHIWFFLWKKFCVHITITLCGVELSSRLVRSQDICATDTKIWNAIIDFQDVNTCINNKMLSFWVHGVLYLQLLQKKWWKALMQLIHFFCNMTFIIFQWTHKENMYCVSIFIIIIRGCNAFISSLNNSMHFSFDELEINNNLITKQWLQWFCNAHHHSEKSCGDLNPQEKNKPKTSDHWP